MVVMSRAPLMPSGWPSAMAPPFTFSLASSKPIVSRVAIGTEAKASLTSQMSMSSTFRSARPRAFRMAGIVPSSMIVGFVPATPVETNRARGSSFKSRAFSGVVTRIPHAPSLMPLELPAVMRPSGLNAGGREASFSTEVVRRGCSSVSNIRLLPPSSNTGTGSISFLKRPSSIARIALRWDQRENSSICSRVVLYLSATRSAEMPCWTISYFSRSFGLSAPGSAPGGARDITSTPPPMTTSFWPVMTSMAARLNACRPDAHIRFTLVPGTDSGNPAISGARRAMFRPCSSTWVTHPSTTSSTIFGSIPVRSARARRTNAARSSGRQSFREPPRFPIGVRTAPTITASGTGLLRGRPWDAYDKKIGQCVTGSGSSQGFFVPQADGVDGGILVRLAAIVLVLGLAFSGWIDIRNAYSAPDGSAAGYDLFVASEDSGWSETLVTASTDQRVLTFQMDLDSLGTIHVAYDRMTVAAWPYDPVLYYAKSPAWQEVAVSSAGVWTRPSLAVDSG